VSGTQTSGTVLQLTLPSLIPSIFIGPLYLFQWVKKFQLQNSPLHLQTTQLNLEDDHGLPYWITILVKYH